MPFKAGSHCDISINISIRIVSVNRRNINISIENGKFSIFLCLCLCCYVACVNRSCISISTSISMSAVFPSAEKHESRASPALKTQKMAAEFEEKSAEAVRKYTSLYNKQSPDFKDKSKRVLSQDDLCECIHFFFLVLVLSLLLSRFTNDRHEIRSKIPISSNSSSSSWSAILDDRVQIHMRNTISKQYQNSKLVKILI